MFVTWEPNNNNTNSIIIKLMWCLGFKSKFVIASTGTWWMALLCIWNHYIFILALHSCEDENTHQFQTGDWLWFEFEKNFCRNSLVWRKSVIFCTKSFFMLTHSYDNTQIFYLIYWFSFFFPLGYSQDVRFNTYFYR